MQRSILYDEEQADPFDILWQIKDMVFALGHLQQDLAGSTLTVASGLGATQTGPASLILNIAAGRVYQQGAIDPTAYGALPSDSTIIQLQGTAPAQTVQLSTAALSAGQSMWALVQAQISQTDIVRPTDPTGGVLNYWNAANPTQPFQGPNNDGASQPTERQVGVTFSVVYGTPATTGSEVPPNPSAGFIPLYLVDLSFGQTTVTTGQILVAGPSVGSNVPSNYPNAPFIAGLLNQHHRGTPGQAPQIDLTDEVKNVLPLANTKASSTSGGGLPVLKQGAGNPNGSVAGNFNVNGASDLYWDTTNQIFYICTVTGSTSTAVWTAIVGGSTSIFAGGTSTGAANAQVVASTTPSGFARTPGQVVTFTAGFTNTTAATLNVDATGVAAIQKNSGGSNVPLTGGELAAGAFITVIWTGSVYLLQSQVLGNIATLNIGQWLKNDGSGNLTIKLPASGALLGDDGSGNFTLLPTAVTPGTYVRPKVTFNAEGQATSAANGTQPTYQRFLSGSGTATPSANVTRWKVRMAGGGGAGASASVGGAAGGQSSLGSWTALGGGGGATNGNPGAGGSGGANGTGTLIARRNGGGGQGGQQNNNVATCSFGVMGGVNPLGGSGQNVSPNTGAGGYAVAVVSGGGTSSGAGGAGEYVEFVVLAPSPTGYVVGAGGATGYAPGAAGVIEIEEFYD